MKKITTMEWLVLAVAVLLVKFFLLPDTLAYVAASIILVGACGLGALVALNRPTITTE
jgi:VIT1/CCC1 family predicted Fe2+/Mn2+ transporter